MYERYSEIESKLLLKQAILIPAQSLILLIQNFWQHLRQKFKEFFLCYNLTP